MKYIFGVMSSRYELECEDEIIAKVAMSLFLETAAPIAIFDPVDKRGVFKAQDILINNKEHSEKNREMLIKCHQGIKDANCTKDDEVRE